MNWLLDTNVVLYFLGGRLAEPLPAGRYFVSVITTIELLSYPSLTHSEEEAIRSFLREVTQVDLSEEIIETTIRIRREEHLKVPDAIVVATTIVLQAGLLSNDERLAGLPGLSCRSVALTAV